MSLQFVSIWTSLEFCHLVTGFEPSYKGSLTHSHTMMPLGNKPLENTEGKGEIAHNEQFLLFPQCFLLISIAFCHFHQV